MSIVCGGGFASCAVSNIVPSGNATAILFYKTPDITQYDCIAEYSNTTSAYFGLQVYSNTIIARVSQAFGQVAVAPTTPVNAAWGACAVTLNSSDNIPVIIESAATATSGNTGAYVSPESPQVTLFQQRNASRPCISGVKIGMYAVYYPQLSVADAQSVINSGSPLHANLVALWADNYGVTESAGDLVEWLDVISGQVISPTGSVTVDSTDMAPHGYIVSGDSIAAINGGAAVTDGQTGVPFTYSGFADPITSILLDTAGNSVPALNITDNRDGTGSFDMPSIAGITSDAGTDVVTFGTIATLFSGVQSDTPSLTVVMESGWTEVTLAGIDTSNTDYLYQLALAEGLTIANGGACYYDSSEGTVAADGQVSIVESELSIVYITAARVAYPVLITSATETATNFFDYIFKNSGNTGTMSSRLKAWTTSQGYTGSCSDRLFDALRATYPKGTLRSMMKKWEGDNL